MKGRSAAATSDLAFALVIVLLLAAAKGPATESMPLRDQVVVHQGGSPHGGGKPASDGGWTAGAVIVGHLGEGRFLADGQVMTKQELRALIDGSERPRVVLAVLQPDVMEILRHAQGQYKKTTLAPVGTR